MSQSHSQLYTHLIFSTKNRQRLITDDVRDSLHRFQASKLKELDCAPVLINSVDDHIHLLFDLSRKVSISKVVEDVKKLSSKWIKTLDARFADFSWQAGSS